MLKVQTSQLYFGSRNAPFAIPIAMSSERGLVFDPTCLLYGGVVSFVVHVLTFKFISPWISRALCPSFRSMPWYTQGDWNDRMISTLNAVVSVVLSVCTLGFESELRAENVFHDSFYSRLACGIVVGYMFADMIVICMWCRLQKGEALGYIFHHAATVYAYFYISGYGVLCYFGMLRLFAELSTPNVNLRWIYDVLGKSRKDLSVLINGVAMVILFFVSRMLTMPWYWFQIYNISGTEAVSKLGYIQLIMYIPCFVLDVLNIFWFYKMCRGLVKALNAADFTGNSDTKFKSV